MNPLSTEESTQQAIYNNLADVYERHYTSKWSDLYRRRFIYEPLLRNINLEGKAVLDAMCGSGFSVQYLWDRGARVTGLDISNEAVTRFREKWAGAEVIEGSLLNSTIDNEAFDCVIVTFGLGHVPPQLQRAMDEIGRILKPGGYLCFAEPHRGSLFDFLRQLWHRADDIFASNEESLHVEELLRANSAHFEHVRTVYGGSLAYIFVFNSMVVRLPLAIMPYCAPPLLMLEGLLGKFASKRFSCFVISQWRKREKGSDAR